VSTFGPFLCRTSGNPGRGHGVEVVKGAVALSAAQVRGRKLPRADGLLLLAVMSLYSY